MMQIATRGSDNSIRGRSRSPEARYTRGGPVPPSRRIVHQPPDPTQIYHKWRGDDLPPPGLPRSAIPPGNRMYSTVPIRTKMLEGRGSDSSRPLGPDTDEAQGVGYEWNEMLTFRTFVIMRVPEEANTTDAVASYDQYKKAFYKEREPRFLWLIKDFPVMTELYNADMLRLEFEETIQRCRVDASHFVKLLAEERFLGITHVERTSTFRSVHATAQPFRMNLGLTIDIQNYTPLSAPFWLSTDPDLHCLWIRKLPPQLSKLDIKEHVITQCGAEGLIDVAITEPTGFELTLKGGHPLRTAWIRFVSEEACGAAELKLEGTTLKNFKLHPLRRVPNPSNYTCRVTPSETCHPARILRDLTLSARLILKLDQAFGVTELLLGDSNSQSSDDSFETRCNAHPVLSDLQLVFNGSGRSAEEQLDLQLLYLRVVHCVCYYSGRRFRSPRHLWEIAGPLYVRPHVNPDDILLSLTGFECTINGGWDRAYTEAVDLTDPEALAATASYPLFLDASVGYNFEPSLKSSLITEPVKDANDFYNGQKIIKEEVISHNETMTDETTTTTTTVQQSSARDNTEINDHLYTDSIIKTELKEDMDDLSTLPNQERGRNSLWLKVLDARIARLLCEDFQKPLTLINDEYPVVQERWNAFCEKVIEEVAAEKWRCGLCAKMFRGTEFVKKHLRNKHTEHLEELIPDVRDELLLESYQADPFRHPIAPPVVAPYVYRRGLPSYQYESPTLGPSRSGYAPPLTLAGDYTSFMPNGPRLSAPPNYQYRDLDAPSRPLDTTAPKNVRETISYDDL